MIMIDPSWSNGLLVAIYAGLSLTGGAALGVMHLASLRLGVARLPTKTSVLLTIGLLFLRLAFLTAILTAVVVLFGVLPLLVVAFGLSVTRIIVLRLECV